MQRHTYQAPEGWSLTQCKEKPDGERISKGSPQDMEEQSHHNDWLCRPKQTHVGYRCREEAAEPKACHVGVPATILGVQAVDQCASAARAGILTVWALD